MPTPDETAHISPGAEALLRQSPSPSCPPEDSRVNVRGEHAEHRPYGRDRSNVATDSEPRQQPTPPADDDSIGMPMNVEAHLAEAKAMDDDEEHVAVDASSPASITSTADIRDDEERPSLAPASTRPRTPSSLALPSVHYDFSNVPVRYPSPTPNALRYLLM